MLQFIVVQILSFVFAVACGLHDVPAVDNFTFYGSNEKHQKLFHGANWVLKFCFVFALSFYFITKPMVALLLFGVCGCIVWMAFDMVLNKFRREKKPWYYLSKGNAIDRTLLSVFGAAAGKYKALFCAALIIAINVFVFK